MKDASYRLIALKKSAAHSFLDSCSSKAVEQFMYITYRSISHNSPHGSELLSIVNGIDDGPCWK